MKNNRVRVFSYGSNMLYQRLANRILDVKKVDIAWLNGYQLVFNKISIDNSSKANLIKGASEDIVYGVVYELDVSQKEELDKFEGKGYEDTKITVYYSENDKEVVCCYLVQDTQYIDMNKLPYDWYKEYVLQGAKDNHLPNSYINMIGSFKSQKDQNIERREENWKILNDKK